MFHCASRLFGQECPTVLFASLGKAVLLCLSLLWAVAALFVIGQGYVVVPGNHVRQITAI